MTSFEKFGLKKKDVERIVKKHFKKNADILLGIDDPEVNQLIEILVVALAESIEKNNDKLSNDIKEYIKNKFQI